MKRYVLLLTFLLLPTMGNAQTDQLDLRAATIVNAPDVRNWPITAALTQLSFDGSTTRVEFTKHHGPTRWPDITPAGWSGPLQYTLWLCVNPSGWVCSGFIQFWEGRDGSGSSADPDVPSLYAKNWYYSSRWTPIYGHGPIQPGESIGMLVTSGNARDNVGPMSVQERSNVVVIQATDRGTFNFAAVPTPTEPPVIIPMPLPITPLPSVDLLACQRIEAKVDGLIASEADFHAKVGIAWKSVMTTVAKYGLPAIGAFIAARRLP